MVMVVVVWNASGWGGGTDGSTSAGRHRGNDIGNIGRRVVEGDFSFRLSFILKPYCDGFYFPVKPKSIMDHDAEAKRKFKKEFGEGGRKLENNIHSSCGCDSFAFFARGMGILVE